jgi:tripartite-type tricarboxylate transporter receptor subunit TctC
MKLGRRSFAAGAAVWAATRSIGGARADTYPSRLIKIIVPISAGSTTDVIARQIGENLRTTMGQTVLVDNRPGAGGTIGSAAVAKAPPDGYTLLVVSASHTANPALYSSLPYDTLKDFKGINRLAIVPLILVTSPEKNIKSVADLVARAKAHPGEMTYGSGGVGSSAHMNAEQFRAMAKFDALHVPYRGTPEMMADIIAGRVDFGFVSTVSALGSVHDGKLVVLACGAEQRSSLFPDVPTTVEAGIAGSAYNSWIGMLAPAGTPPDVIDKLNRETTAALRLPETARKFAAMGAEVAPMTAADFDSFIAKDAESLATLVRVAKIPTN